MSVAVETTKVSYAGTGVVGPYTYPFKIWVDSDLMVIKTDALGVETVLALNTDYTVSGAGITTGGTVMLTAVLPAGSTLTLMRVHPYLQSQNYTSLEAITATSLNNALDKLDHQIQQLKERTDRSFQVPRSSTATGPIYLEPKANWLIGWDSLGTGLKNYPTTTLTVPLIDHIGNHSDSLETAIIDIGTTPQALLVNKGITTLGGSVTVPVTTQLWVLQDGGITHPSGTLSVNNLTAGDYGWFTGPGLLAFGTDWSGDINARWWKTGATTWEAAISAAITAGAEDRTVSLKNATVPLTTGVQARIADRGKFAFPGSIFTPASEMCALDLTYGNLASNIRTGVGRRTEQGNVDGQGAYIDFSGIGTIASSVGIRLKSFSSMVVNGSSIKSAYIGYEIVPCDNLELFSPRLYLCHIGIHVPNWSTLTKSMMMRFHDPITITNDYGIVVDSPYEGVYINGGTFSNNKLGDVFVTNNTPLGSANISYNNFHITGWHSEQGGLPSNTGTPCRKIFFQDVQSGSGTYSFQHVGIFNSTISGPVGAILVWLENARHIEYDGVRSVAASQVLTDAFLTSGSPIVTLGTAQTDWIKYGEVDSVPVGYEKTKLVDATFIGDSMANYRVVWLTGANAGEYNYVDSQDTAGDDTGLITLANSCTSDIATGDTFKLEKIFPGMYLHGRGVPNVTKVLTLDSTTQFTRDKNATLTSTPRNLVINKTTPVYLDSKCLSAVFRKFNWGNSRAVMACDRSVATFEPSRRELDPQVVLAGYDDPALARSDETGTISPSERMSTLGDELATGKLVKGNWYKITATAADHFYAGDKIGDVFRATATTGLDASNKVKLLTHTGFPTEANPKGYRVRVTASDSGGSGTLTFAKSSGLIGTVGQFVALPLTASSTTIEFDIAADFYGDFYYSLNASGSGTAYFTASIVAVYM